MKPRCLSEQKGVFFMQKIKDDLIKKIFKCNLSRIGLVMLLDLINIADERGQVQIYYKDLISLVQCSGAQFYNVLNDLENIGFIKKQKNQEFKQEIEVFVIGNDFTKGYCNYVDTNKIFFTGRQYKNLKAGEIRMYLYFLFRVCKQKYNEDNDKNKLFYNGSYEKIAKQLGVKERMVKIYCKSLKKKAFICIGEQIDCKKKKYDIITLNKESIKAPEIQITEKGKPDNMKSKPLHLHWCHYIKNLCRRYGISYDYENLNDTALLFNQYKKYAKEQSKDIYIVLKNAIINLRENILDSKIVHYIIRSLIGLDYTENIIAY